MRQLWATLLLLALAQSQAAGSATPPPLEQRVQSIVASFRAALAVPEDVVVSIVDQNPLVVSVEPLKGTPDTYLLSLHDQFIASLDEDELRAVVAHELGHVWIFTHHPYLQTEALANRIAMRVVSRESLERVYAKVWKQTGARRELTQFLGR
jgi:hypothetical protein